MTTIVLYSPYWRNMGGGERYMLNLAVSLAMHPSTRVGVIIDSPEITGEKLSVFFGLDLSNVELLAATNARRDIRRIAAGADVFIALSNFRRIEASPRYYVQALQVPYPRITPGTISAKMLSGNIRDGVKDILRKQLLQKSARRSQLTLTNSVFVHDTLQTNFGLKSSVLYPPIEDFLVAGIPKRKIILSVGRFFSGLYNDKRYDVLTAAFRSTRGRLDGWEYHIVGSASDDESTWELLRKLREENAGFPVFFHINEPHERLRNLYNEATVLWHGAGYGVDEALEPERTEHFGMSVAEGLSAGCIPVVVNKGGLKEIVSNNQNGFLWGTTDELVDTTLRIAGMKKNELERLRDNARQKYYDFSLQNFNNRVADIFDALLT